MAESLSEQIARTAAEYEAMRERERLLEEQRQQGTISAYEPKAHEAIAEAWRLWRMGIPDAGLETMLPTEPIREMLVGGKGGLLGKAAGHMMPQSRGDLLLESAMAALPALQSARGAMRSAGLLPRTILGETAPEIMTELPRVNPLTATGRKIVTKPKYRMTAAERANVFESSRASDLADDMLSPWGAGSKPYGQSFWTDFRRGVSGSVPGLAREAASYLARRFLRDEEEE